jgi:8-amino-7-oxononanoate synthase
MEARLAQLEARTLRRHLLPGMRQEGAHIQRGEKTYISFSCNDYLGLCQHPKVQVAAQEATARYGAGAGASRLVSGNHPLYAGLESSLAQAKGFPAALVFGSGYLANLGTLSALMGDGDLILLDKLSHACLLDGAQLSDARWMRFKHNDTHDLSRLLTQHRAAYRQCLIVTETIFSMDGDRAPLSDLRRLADAHDAWLLADDAHGLYQPDETPPVDILVGTLSKALGSYGGYACAAASVIDYLATTARSLMFTTGLPPASIAAASAALEIAQKEPQRAQRALAHAERFCAALGLPAPQSQIVPLLYGEAPAALKAMETLKAHGLLVTAIRPPTVPAGTARLRVSFSAAHTEQQLTQLIETLQTILPLTEREQIHG